VFLQHRPVALAVILAVAGALAAAAQTGHLHIHTIQAAAGVSVEPPGVIDGSVHPELISDQEAITMFWIAVMEPASAAALEKGRFAAKTGGMGLSGPDAALVWSAAVNFNTQFAPYLAQAQQLASAAGDPTQASSLPSITQQRIAVAGAIDLLATATHNGLIAGLSPRGAAALKAQLLDVKKHMKIVPPPKM
jgi:hypothetical protein